VEDNGYLLLRFNDTYIYYYIRKNLLDLCSGSPAPFSYIVSLRMTITFENENNIIIYALEMIISFARENQDIFVAQCARWMSSIIGLQQGLVNHIDNLKILSNIEVRERSITTQDSSEQSRVGNTLSHIHPGRAVQLQDTNPEDSEPELGA